VSNRLKKTGLSGAFINLLRLPLDNFASGSLFLQYFLSQKLININAKNGEN